jgi:chromosome segregation ATPase
MKAISLFACLLMVMPVSSQENKDSAKANIEYEIEKLTDYKKQLQEWLGTFEMKKRGVDSAVLRVQNENIQLLRFVDSMDAKRGLFKKSGDRSTKKQMTLKEWKQTRYETLNKVNDNIDRIDGMKKLQQATLNNPDQFEEMINKIDEQIKELKKMISP